MKTLDSNAAANRLSGFDPQLQQYLTAALPLMQLQTLQTIAAHKDPARFPAKPRQTRLQNSTRAYDNVGLVVDRWLEGVPADKRAKLLIDFNPEKYLTPELRTAMQQARVDLASPKPVLEQVDLKSWFRCVDTGLIQKAVAARSFDEAAGNGASGERRIGATARHTSLTLRLHKVHCVDQTTPGVEEWASHDEICLGGTASSDSGDQTNTTAIPQFLVGKFKDGDEKVYDPPKVLKTFPVSGAYPKTFVCVMAMAERDGGGFATFLSDLLHSITDEIDAVITAAGVAAGAAIGGAIGGPVGALAGAVGVFLVNEIINLIGNIKNDEIFMAQQTSVRMDSSSQKFANETDTADMRHWNFKGHSGEYNVFYSWAYV
jgi:hypothetical protein